MVEFAGGFDIRQRNDVMFAVNEPAEAGTLRPAAKITLLPVPTASYSGFEMHVHHAGDFSEQEVVAHLRDATLADRDHINSTTMYLDFRDIDLNVVATYQRALDAVLIELDGVEVITWAPKLMS